MVTATLDDLAELAIRAPVLAGLEPVDMRSRGLTAPLHPGAEAAFGAYPPEFAATATCASPCKALASSLAER